MKPPYVLIINPFQSNLQTKIIYALNLKEGVEYISIDSLFIDFNTFKKSCPCLILVLLDNCTGNNLETSKFIELSKAFPSTPIISIIDTRTGCNGCSLCQQFAWGFIPAPVSKEDVDYIISWYVKNTDLEYSEPSELYLKQRSLTEVFIGKSFQASSAKDKIIKIAPYNVTVLLQGETGSGKELSAKLIHYLSNRSKGPFVAVNCGTIPPELFENELFGHKKGAYTHADSSENGLISEANRGTLFLDEIESLPMKSQVKLLRFIDEKKYKPLGQTSFISSDVRIISSSNQDLMKLVERGKFRQDLFYRLSVVNIFLAPLRERKEDIPLLTWYFVKRFAKLYSKEIKYIKPEVMMHLTHFTWPGNIRELENILQESVILCSNNCIELNNLDFAKYNADANNLKPFQSMKKQVTEEFEKEYINTLLRIYKGNISKASGFAKKDRREFYRLIRKYNIQPGIFRFEK